MVSCIFVCHLLFSGFVSEMVFFPAQVWLGSLGWVAATVVGIVGLFCSLMRVNLLVLPGQFSLFQGLCLLGMLRPGSRVWSVGCLPAFLGGAGVP